MKYHGAQYTYVYGIHNEDTIFGYYQNSGSTADDGFILRTYMRIVKLLESSDTKLRSSLCRNRRMSGFQPRRCSGIHA